MKVNLKQISCSPHGIYQPGIHVLDSDLAKSLVQAGVAEEIIEQETQIPESPSLELQAKGLEEAPEGLQTRVSAPPKTATTRRRAS